MAAAAVPQQVPIGQYKVSANVAGGSIPAIGLPLPAVVIQIPANDTITVTGPHHIPYNTLATYLQGDGTTRVIIVPNELFTPGPVASLTPVTRRSKTRRNRRRRSKNTRRTR